MNSEAEWAFAKYSEQAYEFATSNGNPALLEQADLAWLEYIDAGGGREPLHVVNQPYTYQDGFVPMEPGASQGPIAQLRELLNLTGTSATLTSTDEVAVHHFKQQHGMLSVDEEKFVEEHGYPPAQSVDRHLWSVILASEGEPEPNPALNTVLHVATNLREPTPMVLHAQEPWALALDFAPTRTIANQHNLALLSLLAKEAPADFEAEIAGLGESKLREAVFLKQTVHQERRWRPIVRRGRRDSYAFTVIEGESDARAFILDSAAGTTVAFHGRAVKPEELEATLRELASNPAEKLAKWPYAASGDLEVYAPFLHAYQPLHAALVSALRPHPYTKPLSLTGHGLGGALAVLAACAIRTHHTLYRRPLQLYTYGQPRVGTRAFADFYWAKRTQGPGNISLAAPVPFVYYRFAHLYDLWTTLPSAPLGAAVATPESLHPGETAQVLQRFAHTKTPPLSKVADQSRVSWELQSTAEDLGVMAVLERLEKQTGLAPEFTHFGTAVLALQDALGTPFLLEDDRGASAIEDPSVPVAQLLWKPADDNEGDQLAWDYSLSVTSYQPMGAYLTHCIHDFEHRSRGYLDGVEQYPPLTGARGAPLSSFEVDLLHRFNHRAAPPLHHRFEEQVLEDPAAFLRVTETRYDGTTAIPEGKHIYVVAEGKVVVSARQNGSGSWHVHQRYNGRLATPSEALLPVPPDTACQVMLAPFALTPAGEQRLAENVDACSFVGRAPATPVDSEAAVTAYDVTARITELHAEYAEALETLQAWRSDEQRRATHEIVSALSIFKDQDAGVAGVLKQQPEAWLDDYDKQEREVRTSAESPVIELALAFESEDYAILETSAAEELGDGAEYLLVQMAVCLQGITYTEPGRHFAYNYVSDEERFPAKFLFTDAERPEAFQPGRRFSLWAQATFLWLAPVAVAKLEREAAQKAVSIKAAHAPLPKLRYSRDILRQYFEELSGVTFTPAQQTVTELVENVKTGWSRDRTLEKAYWELLGMARDRRNAHNAKLAEELAAKLRATSDSARKLKRLASELPSTIGIGIAVVEVLNLMHATANIDANARLKSSISMASALADISAATFALQKELAEKAGKQLGKTLVKRLAMAGLLSGALDSIGFTQESFEANEKGQYEQVAGNALAGLGGGLVGAAGLFELAELLVVAGTSGGALTTLAALSPLALPFAALGTALLLGGVVWVALNERGPTTLFAQFSLLGNDQTATPQAIAWSPVPLPATDAHTELLAVRGLLASFKLDVSGDRPAKLYPGIMQPGDVIEVQIVGDSASDTYSNRFNIQISGWRIEPDDSRNLPPHTEVIYRQQGDDPVVDHIAIGLAPAVHTTITRKTERNVRVRVRLATGDKAVFVPPEKEKGLDPPDGSHLHSDGDFLWVESSAENLTVSPLQD